jgi:hypothetical protein
MEANPAFLAGLDLVTTEVVEDPSGGRDQCGQSLPSALSAR